MNQTICDSCGRPCEVEKVVVGSGNCHVIGTVPMFGQDICIAVIIGTASLAEYRK